jgi:hypothetical protein
MSSFEDLLQQAQSQPAIGSLKLDSIVETIINKFIERSNVGRKKYGTNLDRTDLSLLDWINHAQEEHMDGILYLEKLKQQYKQENQK